MTTDISALLRNFSLECAPRADRADQLLRYCAAGSEVFIPFLPGQHLEAVAAAAIAVRRAGCDPVPHLAARQIESLAALDALLARLNGEAGVTRIMLIAGDSQLVHGPFAMSLPVIASGLLQKHGIRRVNLAGHPEGGSYLARDAGFDVLRTKIDAAEKQGLAVGIVTQFCFEAAPVLTYLADLTRRGITAPVRIGLAGPASPATLLKFALRCGVGNSLRALRPGIGRLGRLLTETGPDEVAEGLTKALPGLPKDQVEGVHFFGFGGLRKLSGWVEERLQGAQARVSAAQSP